MYHIKNVRCEGSAYDVKNATGSRKIIVSYGVKLSRRINVDMNPDIIGLPFKLLYCTMLKRLVYIYVLHVIVLVQGEVRSLPKKGALEKVGS